MLLYVRALLMKCLNYVHVFFQFAMHLLKNSTTRIKIFYFKEMIYIYHPIPYTQLCVAVRKSFSGNKQQLD